MHGIGRYGAHPERGGKQVGAGAQMLDGAQELHAVPLLLQRIVGGGLALHLNGVGLHLQRLLGAGCQHHRAADDQGSAYILRGDLFVIIQLLSGHDHLQILKAGAVVKLNKAKGFHVADGACPAANGDLLAAQRVAVGKNCCDLHTFHIIVHLFCVIFAVFVIIYQYCIIYKAVFCP